MKKLLMTLLLVPWLFSAEPDFSRLKVEPLPFPTIVSGEASLAFEVASTIAQSLESKIGRYPPQLSGPDERAAVYQEWRPAVLAAARIRTEESDSEPSLVLEARLLREGHNMDVRECGKRAAAVIELGMQKFPDSIGVNFQASYFYLQIDPRYAPKGEAALLHLRKLLGSDQNLEVERGLVFAYIYQNKIKEAKKQVDKCLRIAPGNKMLLEFREALKSGKIKRFSNKAQPDASHV